MFKKAIIAGVAIMSLALAGTTFAAENGAETMVLKGGSPGDVAFNHKLHQDTLKDCDTCHKLFPKEADSIQKGIAAGTLKKKEVMKQCMDCHKATQGTTGPTKCKECHKK